MVPLSVEKKTATLTQNVRFEITTYSSQFVNIGDRFPGGDMHYVTARIDFMLFTLKKNLSTLKKVLREF